MKKRKNISKAKLEKARKLREQIETTIASRPVSRLEASILRDKYAAMFD